MKLVNNILAANVLVATADAVVMGVKAGLDPAVVVEVLNAGSGATSASRDKFPRAIMPRTFERSALRSSSPTPWAGCGKPRRRARAPILISRR